jgi:hypothetical protein
MCCSAVHLAMPFNAFCSLCQQVFEKFMIPICYIWLALIITAHRDAHIKFGNSVDNDSDIDDVVIIDEQRRKSRTIFSYFSTQISSNNLTEPAQTALNMNNSCCYSLCLINRAETTTIWIL